MADDLETMAVVCGVLLSNEEHYKKTQKNPTLHKRGALFAALQMSCSVFSSLTCVT